MQELLENLLPKDVAAAMVRRVAGHSFALVDKHSSEDPKIWSEGGGFVMHPDPLLDMCSWRRVVVLQVHLHNFQNARKCTRKRGKRHVGMGWAWRIGDTLAVYALKIEA